jgi:hypothetical protein
MKCDVQRAAVVGGANEALCPTRRGVIGGLATLVATASLQRIAPAQGQYDAALIYFHREFMEAASRLGAVEGKLQDVLYRRMMALATALSIIPVNTARSLLARREVAGWSFQDGPYTLRLPPDLIAALSVEDRH